MPGWVSVRYQVVQEIALNRDRPHVGAWQNIVGGGPWQNIVGGQPWLTIIGQALDVLRKQARAAAEEMPGNAVVTVRDTDGKWRLKAFRTLDQADDWFGAATVEPRDFTYAAYFSKSAAGGVALENEKVGGAREASRPSPPISRGPALASATVSP